MHSSRNIHSNRRRQRAAPTALLALALLTAGTAGAASDPLDLRLSAERLLLDNAWLNIAGGAGTLFGGARSPVLRAWYETRPDDLWLNAQRLDELDDELAVTPAVSSLAALAGSVAASGRLVYLGTRAGEAETPELPALGRSILMRQPAEGGFTASAAPALISLAEPLPEIPLPAGVWMALGGLGLVFGAAARGRRHRA